DRCRRLLTSSRPIFVRTIRVRSRDRGGLGRRLAAADDELDFRPAAPYPAGIRRLLDHAGRPAPRSRAFVTGPTPQCARRMLAFAAASRMPIRRVTRHLGGGGGGGRLFMIVTTD